MESRASRGRPLVARGGSGSGDSAAWVVVEAAGVDGVGALAGEGDAVGVSGAGAVADPEGLPVLSPEHPVTSARAATVAAVRALMPFDGSATA
jgi:hypothetical protein